MVVIESRLNVPITSHSHLFISIPVLNYDVFLNLVHNEQKYGKVLPSSSTLDIYRLGRVCDMPSSEIIDIIDTQYGERFTLELWEREKDKNNTVDQNMKNVVVVINPANGIVDDVFIHVEEEEQEGSVKPEKFYVSLLKNDEERFSDPMNKYFSLSSSENIAWKSITLGATSPFEVTRYLENVGWDLTE